MPPPKISSLSSFLVSFHPHRWNVASTRSISIKFVPICLHCPLLTTCNSPYISIQPQRHISYYYQLLSTIILLSTNILINSSGKLLSNYFVFSGIVFILFIDIWYAHCSPHPTQRNIIINDDNIIWCQCSSLTTLCSLNSINLLPSSNANIIINYTLYHTTITNDNYIYTFSAASYISPTTTQQTIIVSSSTTTSYDANDYYDHHHYHHQQQQQLLPRRQLNTVPSASSNSNYPQPNAKLSTIAICKQICIW